MLQSLTFGLLGERKNQCSQCMHRIQTGNFGKSLDFNMAMYESRVVGKKDFTANFKAGYLTED